MRSIEIEVSPKGVRLVVTSSARAGIAKAIFVVPDGVEVHLAPQEPDPPKSEPANRRPKPSNGAAAKQALEPREIAARLKKLKVKNRQGAVNSIKAMFQFTTPLSDGEAAKKLAALKSARLLSVDADGRVTFPDA
jgi:hypothetical protein